MEGVELKVVNEIKADPLITQNANNNVNGLDNSLNSSEKLNDVFADMKDEMKEVLSHFKSLCSTIDDTERKLKSRRLNEITPQQKSEFNETKTGVNGVIGFLQNGNNILGNVAGGNIAGGVITGVNTLGRGLMNSGTQAALSGATSLGKGLLVGGGVALAAGAIAAGANKLTDVYGDALPGIDSIYSNFGDNRLNSNSLKQNRDYGLSLRDSILRKNIGTGMGAEDFISLTNSLGRYGINDATKAATIAQNSAQWASYTGGNANTYANFAGLIERYGGNGKDALSTIFGAAKATGLEKSQYSEFLEGIQRSMENGIAKGFIKSADDITKNIANITLMSGNSDYWKGEAGINRYNSMSNAMSSNTSLSTSSNMLLFKAMQNKMGNNANWIDVMAQIENGEWGDSDFLNSYTNILNKAYNGDKNSIISTIKENFGLNWNGANEVYNTIYSGESLDSESVKNKIKDLTDNPDYKSDSKNQAEILSNMNLVMTQVGSSFYGAKYGAIDIIENGVTGLYNHFVKTKEKNNDPYKSLQGHSFLNENGELVSYNSNFSLDAYNGLIERPRTSFALLQKEATNGNTTESEIKAYNTLQQAIENGVATDIVQDFLNKVSEAITGGRANGKDGYLFDTTKLELAIADLTKAMNGGIVIEESSNGAFGGVQRGGR